VTLGAFAYGLCLVTALACAVLLTRAYRNSRFRLLFWSAVCFWGLTVTNALTVADLFVVPERNLYGFRLAAGLISVIVLLYGMVWEADSK
jgi:hypothetical protein